MPERVPQWPEAEGAFRPRPSHVVYLRAYSELIDEGGPVNMAAIAKRMGISKQAFWLMRRRCQGLDAWVASEIGKKNEHFAQPIVRRLALTALRGSVPHAELYFKVTGSLQAPGDGASAAVQNNIVIKLAIPRPGDAPVSVGS